MKKLSTTLYSVGVITAICSCSSPYDNWEMPTVIRKNQPLPVPPASKSSQIQPKFDAPKTTAPKRTEQKQPSFADPVVKPVTKPEQPKRTEQKQPTFADPVQPDRKSVV